MSVIGAGEAVCAFGIVSQKITRVFYNFFFFFLNSKS